MYKLNWFLVEKKLGDLGREIFGPNDLVAIFKVTPRAATGFIAYNFKKARLKRIRRGFYVIRDSSVNLWRAANLIYTPSYISLSSALSYYKMIPETVYAMTSVTTRPTREFGLGETGFIYQKIKKEAFIGYQPVSVEGQIVLMATPEKALADFGYFVSLGQREMNDRLKVGNLDRQKLRQYISLFERKNLLTLIRKWVPEL